MTETEHRREMQRLMDVWFSIMATRHSSPYLEKASLATVQIWAAEQLRNCGWDTKPMGLSWGVLVPSDKDTS
jgi:hypothetical protein